MHFYSKQHITYYNNIYIILNIIYPFVMYYLKLLKYKSQSSIIESDHICVSLVGNIIAYNIWNDTQLKC